MNTLLDIQSVSITDNYEIIAKMMHELHLNEFSLFDKTDSWVNIEANYMKHIVKAQEECDGLCLVAYIDETPAGFIFGYLEEQDDSRIEVYTGKELYISDGFVDPKFRRQGIYHKLNDCIEQYYIEKGIKRILRFTLIRNIPTRQFLDNQGYHVTRLLYEKWLE